jgi:hypothetical protein
MAARLKKGDISIKELLLFSRHWYKSVDDKKKRMRMDVKGGKITARRGLDYNRKTKKWEQGAREVRIDLLIKSHPISYEDTSGIKNHYYPITILIKNFNKKMDSAVRWRTGSLYRPKFSTKKISEQKSKSGKDKVRKENNDIQKYNINKGIQMQFFLQLEFTLSKFGLLFGPDLTNGPPKKKKKNGKKNTNGNPDLVPFYDKHMLYVVQHILPRLFNDPKLNQRFDNEDN